MIEPEARQLRLESAGNKSHSVVLHANAPPTRIASISKCVRNVKRAEAAEIGDASVTSELIATPTHHYPTNIGKVFVHRTGSEDRNNNSVASNAIPLHRSAATNRSTVSGRRIAGSLRHDSSIRSASTSTSRSNNASVRSKQSNTNATRTPDICIQRRPDSKPEEEQDQEEEEEEEEDQDEEEEEEEDEADDMIEKTRSAVSQVEANGQLSLGTTSYTPQQPKSERKAAKTLSAILLAFIVTWTPYNVVALLRSLLAQDTNSDADVIPKPVRTLFACYLLLSEIAFRTNSVYSALSLHRRPTAVALLLLPVLHQLDRQSVVLCTLQCQLPTHVRSHS
jgi:hypothetical protein